MITNEFRVYRNTYDIQIGTFTDHESTIIISPQITTTLTDSTTGLHVADGSDKITLKDTVVASNLTVGETYVIDDGKIVEWDSDSTIRN